MNDLVEQSVRAYQYLPRDLAIIKMDNDSMTAMSAVKPRDHAAIIAAIKHEMDISPEFVERAIYRKPVGRDERGKQKYSRGLSIRSAESIRVHFGYNKVYCGIEIINEDTVKLIATFSDFQNGTVTTMEGLVSRRYKMAGGGVGVTDPTRFTEIVIKRNQSLMIREAILRAVPSALKTEMYAYAENRLLLILTPERVESAIQYFAARGVNETQLCAYLGKPKGSWTSQDRANLWQAWTSIEEEEFTVEEIFGDEHGGRVSEKPALQEPQSKKARGKKQDTAETSDAAMNAQAPAPQSTDQPAAGPAPAPPAESFATLATKCDEILNRIEADSLGRRRIREIVFDGRTYEQCGDEAMTLGLSVLQRIEAAYAKGRPKGLAERERIAKKAKE